MKFADVTVGIFYINLAYRQDRRASLLSQFDQLGLSGARQPGINERWVSDSRGFFNKRRYAVSLAKRMALRKGYNTGADAVLMLEDDVVFHPKLHECLDSLEIPDDWKIFLVGGRHIERPDIISPGVVKCNLTTDNQAVLVRRDFCRTAIRALSGHAKGAPKTISYSDAKLAALQQQVPVYAAFPNLAWQARSYSDTGRCHTGAYTDEGLQRTNLNAVKGLYEEMGSLSAMANN